MKKTSNEKELREEPRVSIVIPCRSIDAYSRNCIKHCLEIDYSNYEILVTPDCDESKEVLDKRVRVIPTGSIRPLSKRLEACVQSESEFLAFIDADAFPTKDWIQNAIQHFKDNEVAAVAGPSVTPENSSLLSKASGLILASSFGAGSKSFYFRQHQNSQYVAETPACNMIIRKSTLSLVKSSVLDVWPGEEIALCGMITKDLKKKIIYDPKVVVYHHRRPLLIPHLRQIWRYALIKGQVLKVRPKYVAPQFFMPSFLVLSLIAGFFLAMLNPIIWLLYTSFVLVYLLVSLVSGILVGFREKSLRLVLLVFSGIIATHVCYGLGFIKGILSRRA